MSYLGISIKEAMQNINNLHNGWFLPAIQRPYVWGSRHENEIYICKLFDSILKSYPVGGLIVWNTEEEVPYREFIHHYKPDEYPKQVDKGLWNRKDKWLIYDGQQRLQTLYSCLNHTFNDMVLIFDLLYDRDKDEQGETGFRFVPKNESIDWHEIRMNELFIQKEEIDEKIQYRKAIITKNPNIQTSEAELIEQNVELLWDVFVKTNEKSLAYFPIQKCTENTVNEIFERLNTGGMPLTQSDILFSKIKAIKSDFEENLQDFSKTIYSITSNGFIFNAYNILQLLHLIIKNSTKIVPKNIKDGDLKKYTDTWENLQTPLSAFFSDYLWRRFNINHNSIIPSNGAILPIIVYFYEIYTKGKKFKDFSAGDLQTIHQYFIKSQINNWGGLSSYIDNFTRIIKDKSQESSGIFKFPLTEIESHINKGKERPIEIEEERFVGERWFALKVLTPLRVYQFSPDMKNRFNPEIDHIFPKKLKDRPPSFPKDVDILWNMQPTKGEINGLKRAIHPKLFFTDQYVNSKNETVVGSKYVDEYDFLFPVLPDKKFDFNDPVWDNPEEFIKRRRLEMIQFLSTKYDINLIQKEN